MDLTTEELRKREFLHCYNDQMGNKIAACRILSLSPDKINAWRKKDEIFTEAMDQVESALIFEIEDMTNKTAGTKESALVDFSKAKKTGYAPIPRPESIAKMNAFLEVYPQVGWNVKDAAEVIGVKHSTVSRWRNTYPDFASSMERCTDQAIDFAEGRMFKLMEADDRVAALMVMFFLKTKGKKRGYTEGGRDGTEAPVELQSKETQDAMVNAAKLSLTAPPITIIANEEERTDEDKAINVSQ